MEGHSETHNGREFWTEGHCGGFVIGGADAYAYTPTLWRWLIERFEARSVIDLGCGLAHSIAAIDAMGLGLRVLGVDGSERAIRETAARGLVARHDFADGPYEPPGEFDLCISCEFLEHVDGQYLPNVLETIRAAKCKVLAICAAPPGQPGWNHVSCRSPEVWADWFATIGYRLDVDATTTAKIIADTSRVQGGRPYFVVSGQVMVKEEIQ